ncbi:MAG: HPr family phosphocarrier protein [Actinomycetia bacterium]|nr:HPr family phosphocarrier protein [Actinomycetes bacterium]
MKTFKIIIQNSEGLHARPASRLVSLCHRFDSNITLDSGDMEANGKNVTEVLGLGAEKGDRLTIKITGKDELKAKEALKKLFTNSAPGSEKI